MSNKRILPVSALVLGIVLTLVQQTNATTVITGGMASAGADFGCAPGNFPGQTGPPTSFSLNVFYDEANLTTRPTGSLSAGGWANTSWNILAGNDARIIANGSSREGFNGATCTPPQGGVGWVYGRGHTDFNITFTLDRIYHYTSSVSGNVNGIANGTGFLPAGTYTISGHSFGNSAAFSIDITLTPGQTQLLPNSETVPIEQTSRTKDPINIATGEMTILGTDFSFRSQGPALQLLRVYRSRSGASGVFGFGWHSLLDAHLVEDSSGNVIRRDEEGTGSYFIHLNDGNYAASGGTHAILTKAMNGTFTLKDNHGIVTTYDTSGHISSITDRNGNTLSISLSPASSTGYLEDATGRRITLTLDASGRITQAQDPLNRVVNYSYDAGGNLTAITDALGHTTRYTYDANHNIIELANINGHKTYFAYDAQDRAYQNWQDDDVNKVTLEFQSGGVTLLTDALGAQWHYQFNDFGLEVSHRDPLNRVTVTSWDDDLNRTSVTDPQGRTTTFVYDSQGNLIQTRDALNQITNFSYTINFNLLETIRDASGEITAYEYDAKGNLTKVTDALGNITQMTFDASGNLLTNNDALNNITRYAYNQYGQLISITNALNQLTSIGYDITGNLLSTTDAANHTTSFIHDSLNRLTRINFADGTNEQYVYDAFGNRTSAIDRKGRQTTNTYDIYERLIQVTDPEGGVTQFAYDKEGRRTALTDPRGQTTTFVYDAAGQLKSEINALNQSTSYEYDAAGNLISKTDANNRTTNYTYDGLNRLTRTDYADGTSVAQTFDSLSRRTSMSDRFGTTTYSYDALGQLLTEDGPGASDRITYTYDAAGNRISLTDQDNRTFAYAYDSLNRLKSVTAGAVSAQYAYDTVGNLISITYPNTGRIDYSYDAMSRPMNVSNTSIAGTVSSYQYVYDLAGQVTRKTLLDGSVLDYTYDGKDQLIREVKAASALAASGPYDHTYTYDAAGNRSSWTKTTTLGNFWSYDSAGMPQQTLNEMTGAGFDRRRKSIQTQTLRLRKTFNYDAANRLLNFQHNVEVGGRIFFVESVTYEYDANGNRTLQHRARSGETAQATQYVYDDENRLTNLAYQNVPSAGISAAQYEYNGDGRRTKAMEGSTTINYLFDGAEVLLERDTSGTTVRAYTRAPGFPGGIGGLINQRTKVAVTTGKGKNKITTLVDKDFYYHYDALGSVTEMTDDSGALSVRSEYDAFGNKVSESNSIGNTYQFSTKEWEAHAGLSYFGARYYDSSIGRWLTPDPLGFVDGLNVYRYAANNPTSIVDPYGEMGERLHEALYEGGRELLVLLLERRATAYKTFSDRYRTEVDRLGRSHVRGPLGRYTFRSLGLSAQRALGFWRWVGRVAFLSKVVTCTTIGLHVAEAVHLGVEVAKAKIGLYKTELEIQRNIQRRSLPFIPIDAGGTCNPRSQACVLP